VGPTIRAMTTANEFERQRWNDEYWATIWIQREPMTDAAGDSLLESLALQAGERVVDVGSGTGATTLRAASLVGPTGTVLGADISAPLVAHARSIASDRDVANASFEVADVQTDPLPGGPFDVAMSQFGVMFFEEPVVAFANLRAHVVAGGRLGFACWRTFEENLWFPAKPLQPFLAPPAPPAPGKHATGPFALADYDDTRAILEAAGWHDVDRTTYDVTVTVERGAVIHPDQPAFLGVAPERVDEANRAVDAYYETYARPDGQLALPLKFQVVTATNP
jgi:SAM-dependent methyltransferase